MGSRCIRWGVVGKVWGVGVWVGNRGYGVGSRGCMGRKDPYLSGLTTRACCYGHGPMDFR